MKADQFPLEVPVVVIGGGPAGSTVSTLVAQKGHRVVLLERDHFPRFHIGESLIPETYWTLKRLNMLDKMKQSHFVKKHSVQFVGQSGRLSEPFYFLDHKPHECSQTWQVLRSEFDQMMLDNAREHGVEVHEGVRVLEVLFEGQRAVGVKFSTEDGTVREIRAQVVVDASGQSTMIAGRLGLREWDSNLRKGAVWTYWKGAYRDKGRDEGATIVLQTQGKKGWFWYIPLHDDIVSVGIVAPFDELFKKGDGSDHEAIYFSQVELCPEIKRRISVGTRCDVFRVAKEYSYRSREAAGDGWVCAGDAYGFLDPLYSSGVLLALKSGELAADAITEGLERNDTSAAQLGKWAPDFKSGMDRMRRLVIEYYEGFSFGRYVKKNPEQKGNLTDLLIGDLFKEKFFDETFRLVDEMKNESATS
ncbi:MAG TPA: NAD(P)/FAD-dependent oxidoreductase [Planctomycetaceae bacterium]|nr:NAD(P)/FAD-dependent oxidoreductase [Planctomycetaceae bacterium]